MTDAPRLLITRLSSIGDCINALPLLRAVREGLPEAHIAWLVEDFCADVVRGHPWLDAVFVFEKRQIRDAARRGNLFASFAEFGRLCRRLRRHEIDIALDIQGLLKGALILRFSGARTRVGFTDDRRERAHWIHTDHVEPGGLHAVDRFMGIARFLDVECEAPRYCFHITPEAEESALALLEPDLEDGEPLVALNPGASRPHNHWFAERFSQVADELAAHHEARIVVLGGPGDVPKARQIAEAAACDPLVTAGRTSLKELAAILHRCDCLVTCDTGPMHMASAVGTPTVSLMGPSHPDRTGPYGDFHEVLWHTEELDCGPCLKHPTCDDRACMAAITVDEVVAAVARQLARSRPPDAEPLVAPLRDNVVSSQ